MPDTFTIRRAARQDEEGLRTLWLDFLNEQAAMDSRFKIAEDAEERWRNDYEALLKAERRRIYVAERDGELAGFITAARYAPLPIYALASEVFVEEIYVRPDARHHGIGEHLLGAVRAWADELKADRLRIVALSDNAEGRAFWERAGAKPFSVTYTIEFDREDKEEGSVKPKARLGF